MRNTWPFYTYLGHLKEVLCDLNNTAQLLDVLDPFLHSVGVVCSGAVKDILLLLDLTLGPLLIHGPSHLSYTGEDAEETECSDGFFIEDIKLIADSGDRETSTGGENGSLRHQTIAWDGIDDGLGLGFGVFGWNVGY